VLKKDQCVSCSEQVSDPKELSCGHKCCLKCFEKNQSKSCMCSEHSSNAAAAASAADNDKDALGLKQEESSSKPLRSRVLKKDDCVICLEPMIDPKQLDCGHKFCKNCIDEYFKKGQPKCPSCGKLFGVLRGNQPPGRMSHTLPRLKLAGYESYGAIEITYDIPSGIQRVSICNVI